MKMIKLEKIFVNLSARARNINTVERLFGQIDLSNVKRVLDVGCGVGVLCSYLAENYGWEVTGIDVDPEQVGKAKNSHRGNKSLTFVEADATRLPFGDNAFDLVLFVDALHHIANWHEALNEIGRVLRPHGFYVLSDIAFPKLLKRWSLPVDDMADHLRRHDFEIVYDEKPQITMVGSRFSMISQSLP